MDFELFVAFGGSCKSWAASPGLPKFLRSRLSTWCPGTRARSSKGTSAWAQISESREAPRPVTDPYKRQLTVIGFLAAEQLVHRKPFCLKSLVPIRKGFPRGFFRTVVVLEQIFGPHEENFAAIAFPIAVGSLITECWTYLH